MSDKKVKKIKKQIVWAVTGGDAEGYITTTRKGARLARYPGEKILRIEINGKNVSAKFVR